METLCRITPKKESVLLSLFFVSGVFQDFKDLKNECHVATSAKFGVSSGKTLPPLPANTGVMMAIPQGT
jgi:hypothetical protein